MDRRLSVDEIINKEMLGSFLWMFIGLSITFGVVFLGIFNQTFAQFAFTSRQILTIVLLLTIFGMSFGMYRLDVNVLKLIYLGYAAVMGIFLIPFVYIYSLTSVLSILSATAVLFLVLAIYGYTTDYNLLGIGKYLFAGLIGLIVSSLLNVFLFRSNSFDFFLTVIGLLIFIVYVAYDTQRIKENIRQIYYSGHYEILDRVKIVGALSLYTDFINLFIRLLALFGRRNN